MGSLCLETQVKRASSPDKDGAGRHCQTICVRQAKQKGVREEPVVEPPQVQNRLQLGGYGSDRSAHPGEIRLDDSKAGGCCVRHGGHGEGLRRTHGDAAGEKLGASSVERSAVNMGCAGINRHEERDENARHRRYSEPRWPRVMRRHPQGCRRSVDRGTYRSAIEPRNNSFGVPTPSHEAEGHIMSSAIASCFWTLRGLRPCACTESSCARTGRSHARPSVDHRAGRSGKAEAVSLR